MNSLLPCPIPTAKNPAKRYPVLYYLDAYWDFPLVYATYGNLRYDKAIPEVILVGLSIAGDGFGAYRTRYFSIFSDSQKTPTGQASQLYQHLTQDIIPSIDAQSRTLAQPTGACLRGKVWGAYLRCHGLLQNPRLLAVLSPSTQRWPVAKRSLRSWKRPARKILSALIYLPGSRGIRALCRANYFLPAAPNSPPIPRFSPRRQGLAAWATPAAGGDPMPRALWALQVGAQRKKQPASGYMEADTKAPPSETINHHADGNLQQI